MAWARVERPTSTFSEGIQRQSRQTAFVQGDDRQEGDRLVLGCRRQPPGDLTVHRRRHAGLNVSSIRELLDVGVYFSTAVKCGKTGYGIKTATIRECSLILKEELGLFPNLKAYMLMGDSAIRALNYIAKRQGKGRVIPAGSTYKIRGQHYSFAGRRAFPSYLQAGPSFFIEKSKRRMIAEDITEAMNLLE